MHFVAPFSLMQIKYSLTSRWCFLRIRLSRDRTSILGQLRRKTEDLQPRALRLVQRSTPGFPCHLQNKMILEEIK